MSLKSAIVVTPETSGEVAAPVAPHRTGDSRGARYSADARRKPESRSGTDGARHALLPRSVGAVAQADAPSAPQRADASVSRAFANLIYVSSVVAQRDTNPSVTLEVRGNVRVPGRRSGAGSQAQVVRLNVMQIRAEGSTSSARLGR